MLDIVHIAINMLRAGTPLSTVAQMAELPEAVYGRWQRSMGLMFRRDRYVIEDDKPLVIGRLFV